MPLICKIDETKPNKIINTKTITQYLADDNVHIIHNSTADKEKNQQNKSNSNYKSKTPPPSQEKKKREPTWLRQSEASFLCGFRQLLLQFFPLLLQPALPLLLQVLLILRLLLLLQLTRQLLKSLKEASFWEKWLSIGTNVVIRQGAVHRVQHKLPEIWLAICANKGTNLVTRQMADCRDQHSPRTHSWL